MVKKTVGYVELEWPCPNCGNRNPGTARKCATCGLPQPADVLFTQGPGGELLVDEAKIEQAKLGPDIHCPYCGTRNLAGTERCKQCGGDLVEGSRRATGRVVGALPTGPVPTIKCPSCGSENPASATKCATCGAALGAPAPAPAPAARPAPAGSGSAKWLVPALLVLVVACIGIFAFLNLRTSDLVGEVADVAWQRRVVVEALVPVTRQNWRDQIPGDVAIDSCTERVRRTVNEPAPNSVEICGTPYVVDTGTGLGEVVQDCQYQVYDDWCDYTDLTWRAMDSIVASGEDLNPSWPPMLLAEGQRQGGRQEEYVITFATDGKDYTYTVSSEQAFRQFTPGSRWKLEVNTLGAVLGVEPVR